MKVLDNVISTTAKLHEVCGGGTQEQAAMHLRDAAKVRHLRGDKVCRAPWAEQEAPVESECAAYRASVSAHPNMAMRKELKMKVTSIVATIGCVMTLATSAMAHPHIPGHKHAGLNPVPQVLIKPAPRVARQANAANTFCVDGSCSGSVTTTGPQENSLTRSGYLDCVEGVCTRSRSVTGPEGETASIERSRYGECVDGTCTGGRSVTGPQGETAGFERTVSR